MAGSDARVGNIEVGLLRQQGGPAKGVVLTYEDNPPGGFQMQVRKLLTGAGAAMRVEMLSLGDVEAGEDAGMKAAEETERAKTEAAAAKRKLT